MIEIYIKNFMWEGSFHSEETLLQTIPDKVGGSKLLDPKVKAELGKATTFEFSIPQNHPYYNAFMQMKTIMRVKHCGITLFRGRVLDLKYDMYGQYSVHCEGDFTFFMDTPQAGTKEETRPEISVADYLEQVVEAHNSFCSNEPDKQILLGEYPEHYSQTIEEKQKVFISDEQRVQQFGSTSWNNAMNRLEDLLGDFGGYMRTRYVEADPTDPESTPVVYLDWFDQYYRHNPQTIAVAKNLIELSASVEVENIFTVVIPIGKQKSEDLFLDNYWPSIDPNHELVNYITVPEIATLGIFTDEELNRNHHTKDDYLNAINKYGYITKVVTFENADVHDKLFSYATDWIKRNYIGRNVSYEVTAIDMVNLDVNQTPLLVGDSIILQHPIVPYDPEGLTVITAEYDLYELWKSKFKIGVPNEMLNAAYGVKKKDSGGKGGGGGGGGGASNKKPEYTPEQIKARYDFLTQYSMKTDSKMNIELDDPLAFLVYDDKGKKLSSKKAAEKLKKYDFEIRWLVSSTYWKLNPEAALNDPKFARLKKDRDDWKNGVQDWMVSCGLERNFASTLMNEKWGSTWMANYVDDNGNPKELRPYSQDFIDMCVESRKVYKELETSPTDDIFNKTGSSGYFPNLFSGNFSAGNNVFNVNSGTSKVISKLGDGSEGFEILGYDITKIGDALNTTLTDFLDAQKLTDNPEIQQKLEAAGLTSDMTLETMAQTLGIPIPSENSQGFINDLLTGLNISAETKELFKPLTDLLGTVNVGADMTADTKNGQYKAGKTQTGGWKVIVNDTVTYKDEQQQTHTVDGTVSAQDVSLPKIPSFKTDYAEVKRLAVTDLSAVKAKVQDLEADIANFKRFISVSGNVSQMTISNGTLGSSAQSSVVILGQQVRIYTVEDTAGNVHHVFGYT